ncbi:hypothetical protein BJ878DRAFT_324285 [Calycina marina]|uniref:5'-3' DNA helicase ZGRF1-like N-terminal domain-containing protein n=1 Tax=Calycina marina TaxID=1763456 RepID=A0A9P8CG65_9HELO|nr:hypothetical protein BJ878DRAFT_324285 [Calycina marina]
MNQSSSFPVPLMQNTALVLEFGCLYTHDIRRKNQKRWQEGRLKFHKFNKRVVVYDERSSYIGDMHWQGYGEFAEGEELRLERGGVEVQVGECTGKRDQDLYDLVDKRIKEKGERAAAKAGSATTRAQGQPANTQHDIPAEPLRPKSLNAVIGTPTGHYGRAALPTVSPFEKRQRANEDGNVTERPAKRQRRTESTINSGGYAQNLTGATLNLGSQKPFGSSAIRYEPFKSSLKRPSTKSVTKGDTGKVDDLKHKESASGTVDSPNRVQKKKAYSYGPWTMNLVSVNANLFGHRSPPRCSGYASGLTGAVLNLGIPRRSKTSSDRIAVAEQSSPPCGPHEEHPHRLATDTNATSSDRRSLGEYASTPKQPSTELDEPAKKRRKAIPIVLSDSPTSTALDGSGSMPPSSPVKKLLPQAERPKSKLQTKARPPRTLLMISDRPAPAARSMTISTESHWGEEPSANAENIAPELNTALKASNEAARKPPPPANVDAKKVPNLRTSSPVKPMVPDQRDTVISRLSSVQSNKSHGLIDKPVSALRIRSRPPQKMMMLMGRPSPSSNSPRQISHTEEVHSNGEEQPERRQTPKLSAKVHSTNEVSKVVDSLKRPSMPVGSGIDHVRINSLLFNESRQRVTSTTSRAQSRTRSLHSVDSEINGFTGQSGIIFAKKPNDSPHEADDSGKSLTTPGFGGKFTTPTPVNPDCSRFVDQPGTESADAVTPNRTEEMGTTLKLPTTGASNTSNSQATKNCTSPSPNTLNKNSDCGSGGRDNDQIEIIVPPQPLNIIPQVNSQPQVVNSVVEQAYDQPLNAGLPRARIANPATRGQSIQATANKTVDFLAQTNNPLPKDMLPPPPVITTVNSRRTTDKESTLPASIVSAKTFMGGPWSRESFDLFGSWRPPEREALPNPATTG